MPNDGYKRKLAAILSADARDYCRLMGEDEAGTVRTIQSHFQVISERIVRHGGRWWTLRAITCSPNSPAW